MHYDYSILNNICELFIVDLTHIRGKEIAKLIGT